MKPAAPARIHLLAARDAPQVVVIRRKPSKCFHVIRWNTQTDELEQGSWFRGKLYPLRCDVSFDGQWMVYLAMGGRAETWNGICRLPFLRTVVSGNNQGTWNGGGYWSDSKTLMLNQWKPSWKSKLKKLPFKLTTFEPEFGGEDQGVLFPKWIRDGWQRRGENYGTNSVIRDAPTYTVECEGDDGWQSSPSRQHPALVARYVGYLTHGYTFQFHLEGHPDLLDHVVDSATWDSLGQLVFSRLGVLRKLTLADLIAGRPGTAIDLEPLMPHQR